MNRRQLLKFLLASPLALTMDVEQLLWTPGQQIVVPALPRGPFDYTMMDSLLKEIYLPVVTELLNQDPAILALFDA